MLEIQRLRIDKDQILIHLNKRGVDYSDVINQALTIDGEWRMSKTELDNIAAESNGLAKEIGLKFKQGLIEEANVLKEQAASLKGKESELKEKVEQLNKQLSSILYTIPNVPNSLVKKGKSAEENEIVMEYGNAPTFDFKAMEHWDLAKKHRCIDFELGVKVTGAGFPFYRNKGARLQRALISFFLDEATRAGYEEFISPHVVNEASGIGTGQLPDKEGQMYFIGEDHLYLIPTAEVPLTNIYRDHLFSNEDFSIKMCGYTPCFRREAGSYGKDVRGLNRLHQFDKVEIVRIEHPDNTEKALDEMVEHVSGLLKKLGLQFRVLRLCGGDMGFAAAMTYDFEVYSAAQEKWLEVSSVSRFDTFQSNRLKLRFKGSDKKSRLAHTLNGSALALPRIMAAIMENFQTSDSIVIPEVLRPYTGFDTI